MAQMSRVHEDEHSLYIKRGGFIFRPVLTEESQDSEISPYVPKGAVDHSTFYRAESVRAYLHMEYTKGQSILIHLLRVYSKNTPMHSKIPDEVWSMHGKYLLYRVGSVITPLRPSYKCWDPCEQSIHEKYTKTTLDFLEEYGDG